MRGVRGGEPARTPGEFRRSQNWIGGASPASARFVPSPHEQLDEVFGAFEVFLHDDSRLAPIVKVGLAHAQFETILNLVKTALTSPAARVGPRPAEDLLTDALVDIS